MTEIKPFDALTAFVSKDVPRLSEVLAQIVADAGLIETRRRDLASALRSIARALDRPLEALPADVRWLRAQLARIPPARLGITKKRWHNVISDALAALRHAGIVDDSPTRRIPLTPEWQQLWRKVEDHGLRNGLSCFVRFCSSLRIAPDAVDDAVIAAYRIALDGGLLRKNPDLVIYHTTTCWNRAGHRVDGWPRQRLTVPDRSNRYALPWKAFPESLRQEVERCLAGLSEPDPFADSSPSRPLSPATIAHRRQQLRRFASALVLAGVPVETIVRLETLVDPEIAKRGLRFMLDRNGGRTSGAIWNLGNTLKGHARYLMGADSESYRQFVEICRRLRPQRSGMTDKNRSRLRQFDDPANAARLLHLPERLLREADRRSTVGKRTARSVEAAVGIELLFMCELRLKNLAGLRLDRHLQWTRAAGKGVCHLVIERHEVKNREHLEFELSGFTLELLERFRSRYRPLLAAPDCPWLFARGDGDGPVPQAVLARRISKTILERTGLRVNPHLFRHLGSKIYLDRHPGGYEFVRRMLGHKSMSTTLEAYTGLEAVSAAKHFDAVLKSVREETPVMGRVRRKPASSWWGAPR